MTSTVNDISGIQGSPPSKVDGFSGKHTTSLVVALLFGVTLILFVIMLIFMVIYKTVFDYTIIITGFFSLLFGLAGFFAGSNFNKND